MSRKNKHAEWAQNVLCVLDGIVYAIAFNSRNENRRNILTTQDTMLDLNYWVIFVYNIVNAGMLCTWFMVL